MLEVMDVLDNEQNGAEPAIEAGGPRPRYGPTGVPDGSAAVAGGSGPQGRTASGEWTGVAP